VSAAGVADIGAELLQVPQQPSEPLIGQAAGVSLSVRPTGQYHRPDVPGPTPEGCTEQSGDHVCGPSLNLRLKTSSTVQTGIDALVGTVTAWSAT